MHLPALVLVSGILLTLSPGASEAQAGSIDQVKSRIAAGDYDTALAVVESFLSHNPADAQGRFLKGVVLTEQNRTDAAIEVFTRLAADYPNLPEPHNNLAVLYASRGEYVRARDELLLAINTHSSYATAHENLGDIYAKMAGLAYDKALQLDGESENTSTKLTLVHELVPVDSVVGVGPSMARETETLAPEPETDSDVFPATLFDGVLEALLAWARAWSNQDVERYLDFYGDAFVPSGGASRSQWVETRRTQLRGPRFIRVAIDDPRIEVRGDDRVSVTFVQSYQSDTSRGRVRKELIMAVERAEWKIVAEATVE